MEDDKTVLPDATNQDDQTKEVDEVFGGEGNSDKNQKPNVDAQLLARAKKAEAEARELKEKLEKSQKSPLPTEEKDTDIRETVKALELAEKKRQFGYENNLSPIEVDYLFKINPNPTKDLLGDDFIKGGLDSLRAKSRVESNTPSPSSRPASFVPPKTEGTSKEDKQKAFEEWKSEKFGR